VSGDRVEEVDPRADRGGERVGGERHAILARVALHALERDSVGVVVDERVDEQVVAEDAAVDDLVGRGRRDDMRAAARTGARLDLHLPDDVLSRHDVELLRGGLHADTLEKHVAVRAGPLFLGDEVRFLDARQVGGELGAAMRGRCLRAALLRLLGQACGLVVGRGRGEERELKLQAMPSLARRTPARHLGREPLHQLHVEVAHPAEKPEHRRDEQDDGARGERVAQEALDRAEVWLEGAGDERRLVTRRLHPRWGAPQRARNKQRNLAPLVRLTPRCREHGGGRRRRRRGPGGRPARAPRGAAKVDALEDQQQLGGLERHAARLARPRHAKRALLQAFRDQDVAIAIPVEDAHTVGSPREEDEHRSRQRVFGEVRSHDRRQAVDALPSIDARRRDENLRTGREGQHGAATRRRATASTSRATCSTSCEASTRMTAAPTRMAIGSVVAREGGDVGVPRIGPEGAGATCTNAAVAATGTVSRSRVDQ
jgi:hypothetical protein